MDIKTNVNPSSDFADLDAMFGQEDEDARRAEHIVLTQNLEGFASCFPDWDIHPPIRQAR